MVLWALLLFESNCKIFLPESVVTVCFRGEEGGLNRFLLCELFHLVYLCMSLGLSMNVVFKVYFFDCKGFFLFFVCVVGSFFFWRIYSSLYVFDPFCLAYCHFFHTNCLFVRI